MIGVVHERDQHREALEKSPAAHRADCDFGRQSNKITYNRKGHNIDIWMSTYISECCVNVCGMNERDVTERSEIARGVRKESSWKARMVIRKGQKSS